MATITGTTGDDVLIGTTGDDTYTGFLGGNDVVYDFGGYDTYIMDGSFADFVGDMQDDVMGTETLSFAGGSITFNGAGWDDNDSWGQMEHIILNDFIFKAGTAGDDLMDFSATGHGVSLWADAGDDTLIGTAFNDELGGDDGADSIVGGAGNDRISAGGGNGSSDTVDGGDGFDILEHHGGDWGYGMMLVDPLTLAFVVQTDGGVTHVRNVEQVVGSGGIGLVGGAAADNMVGADGYYERNGDGGNWTISTNDSLFGLEGNDTLSGGVGNDYLDGGEGVDNLVGGDGDDHFVVDNAGDTIGDTSGNDTVTSRVSWSLASGLETLMLAPSSGATNGYGNSASNQLLGNGNNNLLEGRGGDDFIEAGSGNDTLNGGIGMDVMQGGNGNDTYYIDNVADRISENGDGYDVAYVSVSYDIGLLSNPYSGSWIGVEKFVLQGTNNLTLTDYAATDTYNMSRWLVGNDGANTLYGLSGNDTLDGGLGADRLVGGTGHDVYYVGDATDVLVENAGEGQDLVFSSVALTLAANVEHLVMGGTVATGTGNVSNNTILGNDAANSIKGMTGHDTLEGMAGNDTLDGGDGHDYLSGGASADYLKGGAGNDTLVGGAGNDTLVAGGGNDLLIGGIGADRFLFNTAIGPTNVDNIQSFTTASDVLQMEDTVFTGMAVGVLAAGRFVAGPDALDSTDRFMYDAASGSLYYDADGNGAGAKVLLAVIDDHATLVASDINIV